MSKCSRKSNSRSSRALQSPARLLGRQRGLVVRLLGFPVRRQVGLSVLARRAQALDVPVHGAKVGLRRLLHAPPRHGGRGLNVLIYTTQVSSVIAGTVSRRLEAYVVPQGPRHPSGPLPRSQSFSGTSPSLGA